MKRAAEPAFVSASQLEAEFLEGYQASPLWEALDSRERQLVEANHDNYPLGEEELAAAARVSVEQIASWRAYIPRRSSGPAQGYHAAALVRALLLSRLGPERVEQIAGVHFDYYAEQPD
jgi:hypothetical protein